MVKKCTNCKKRFRRSSRESRVRFADRRFCSRHCFQQFESQCGQKRKNRPSFLTRVTACVSCGSPMVARSKHIACVSCSEMSRELARFYTLWETY